jgi:glycerol-3-phosphate acyltransferase PlsY
MNLSSLSQLLLPAAIGFLCGSIPFGYWAGKLKGVDIRQHGSGNIGATNVIRVCGKPIGIPVFILDMLKGFLPVMWVKASFASNPAPGMDLASAAAVLTGFAAILGHTFTPWLGFKGGKGVATATGVLVGIAPVAMLAGLAVWLAAFFSTRYVSLASMLAAVTVPVTMAVMMGRSGRWDGVLLGFGVLVALLVILRHRANIKRLLAGTENRSGGTKKAAV